MKTVIRHLQRDSVAYLFFIIGVLLILFPEQVGQYIGLVVGSILISYGLLITSISLFVSNSNLSVGKGIINLILGSVTIIHQTDATSYLGVLWAIRSLYDIADEIDEFIIERKWPIFKSITIFISVSLAIALLTNPTHHFNTHVRILGLEMLTSLFLRNSDKTKIT